MLHLRGLEMSSVKSVWVTGHWNEWWKGDEDLLAQPVKPMCLCLQESAQSSANPVLDLQNQGGLEDNIKNQKRINFSSNSIWNIVQRELIELHLDNVCCYRFKFKCTITPMFLTVGQAACSLCWDAAMFVQWSANSVPLLCHSWRGSCVGCSYSEASKWTVWGSLFLFYLKSHLNKHYEGSLQVAAEL